MLLAPGCPSSPNRAPRLDQPCALCWAGALALALAGCGAEDDGDTTPDDGRVHPPPNGVRIDEDEACTRLSTAFRDQALALGCSSTTRGCPDLLRSQFVTACLQYDEGSVAGCVAYYRELTQCSELDPEMCVVTPYPGSEPAGCSP